VTTSDNPARWAADPLGRHEYRYWDGAQWTEHVSDAGIVGTDPPVTGPAPTSQDVPPTATPDVPPEAAGYAAGYAAPTSSPATPATPEVPVSPAAPAAAFGATHLGAPPPGSGASAPGAWSQPAWSQPSGSQPAWPQASPAHDATGVLGRRYGAFLIDAAISLIVFGAIFFATASTHTRAEMLREPGCHLSANDSAQVECDNRAVVTVNDTVYEAEGGVYLLASIVFTLLYFALMEGLTGATLGKHMTGLRVVTPEGAKPGLGRALVRWAVFAIDGPLSLFLCGIITSSVSAGHRRLGDMAASTFVVGKADAGRPVTVRPR
jgi:uncharacterized RDD family membrane protein YckC